MVTMEFDQGGLAFRVAHLASSDKRKSCVLVRLLFDECADPSAGVKRAYERCRLHATWSNAAHHWRITGAGKYCTNRTESQSHVSCMRHIRQAQLVDTKNRPLFFSFLDPFSFRSDCDSNGPL